MTLSMGMVHSCGGGSDKQWENIITHARADRVHACSAAVRPSPSLADRGLHEITANAARVCSVPEEAMLLASARPFQLHVPDAALADLRERLARTRFPDQAPGEPWAYGTPVDYLRELVDYWRDRFDWRAQEARLNALPQFKVPLARHRAALPVRAGPGTRSVSAAAVARLAGLGVRVPRPDPAPHRPGALRRRRGRCVHRGGAVVAGLRAVVHAGAAALRHRGDRRLFRRPDDRRARPSSASPRRAATGAPSSRRGSVPCMPTR